MALFEFILVAVSIVIGLAVTNVLQGVVGIAKRWRGRRLYWVHVIWIWLVLFGLFRAWWLLWDLRGHAVWTFAEFLLLTAYVGTMFVAASFIAPLDGGPKDGDGKSFYYGIKRDFFLWGLINHGVGLPYLWFHVGVAAPEARLSVAVTTALVMMPIWFILMRSDNEWLHRSIAVVALLATTASIIFELGPSGSIR